MIEEQNKNVIEIIKKEMELLNSNLNNLIVMNYVSNDYREYQKLGNKELIHFLIQNDLIIGMDYIGSGKNGSDGYFDTNDNNKNFELLDKILLKIAPNISFLHYKFLTEHLDFINKKIIDTSEGYYGHYEKYSTYSIKVSDLLNYLNENELLISEEKTINVLQNYEKKSKNKIK
jgi:hypothetical protein